LMLTTKLQSSINIMMSKCNLIIIFDELIPLNVVQPQTIKHNIFNDDFFLLDAYYYYYYYDTRHNIFQLTYIVIYDFRKKLCGLEVSTY